MNHHEIMKAGDDVIIQGLVIDQQYNGTKARLIEWVGERWSVLALGGQKLALRKENLTLLQTKSDENQYQGSLLHQVPEHVPIGKDIMPSLGYRVEINSAAARRDRPRKVYEGGTVCDVMWPTGETERFYTGKNNSFELILATKPVEPSSSIPVQSSNLSPRHTNEDASVPIGERSSAKNARDPSLSSRPAHSENYDNHLKRSTFTIPPIAFGQSHTHNTGQMPTLPAGRSERGTQESPRNEPTHTNLIGSHVKLAIGLRVTLACGLSEKGFGVVDKEVVGEQQNCRLGDLFHSRSADLVAGDVASIKLSGLQDQYHQTAQTATSPRSFTQPRDNVLSASSSDNVNKSTNLLRIGLQIPASECIRVQEILSSGGEERRHGVIIAVDRLLLTCTVRWDSGALSTCLCGKANQYDLEPEIVFAFPPKLTQNGATIEKQMVQARHKAFSEEAEMKTETQQIVMPQDEAFVSQLKINLHNANRSQTSHSTFLAQDELFGESERIDSSRQNGDSNVNCHTGLSDRGSVHAEASDSAVRQHASQPNRTPATNIGLVFEGSRVTHVVPGSAAAVANRGGDIQIGDEIVAVDGLQVTLEGKVLFGSLLASVEHGDLAEAVSGRDTAGSCVRLTIRKSTTGRVLDIELERELAQECQLGGDQPIQLAQEIRMPSSRHVMDSDEGSVREIDTLRRQVTFLNVEILQKNEELRQKDEQLAVHKSVNAELQDSIRTIWSEKSRSSKETDNLRILIGEQQAKLMEFESKMRDSMQTAELGGLEAYGSFVRMRDLSKQFELVTEKHQEALQLLRQASESLPVGNSADTPSDENATWKKLESTLSDVQEMAASLMSRLRKRIGDIERKATASFRQLQAARLRLDEFHFASWQNPAPSVYDAGVEGDTARV